MREIKVRMWSKIANKYFYDPINVFECLTQQQTGRYDHIKDGMAFEQYTGLKDKNGKDIYEGDILRDGKGGNLEVKYRESTAMFLVFEGNECWYLNEGDPNRPCQLQYTEIIGNIHKNPNLLEEMEG